MKLAYKSYIQIGGYYSQQGVQYRYQFFDFGKKVTQIKVHKIDYGKIPIILKQSWGDWYTTIGLYAEFAVNSKSYWKEKTETEDSIHTETQEFYSFTNELRLYDAGLALGIGGQFAMSKQYDFFFQIGYNNGFFAVNPTTIRTQNKMYNRFFTVNVGIIINKNTYKYKSRR